MGPIRAYSRPSHGVAAGEFVTSSSPYSHSRSYSSRHGTFCVHTTPLDDAQHTLYSPVCTSDTLRVGLPSPSASLQPGLFHIKKLLPPGEASTDPHPTHSSQQQDGEGTEQDRWGTGVEQEQKEEEELEENEWEGGGSGRGNVGWHVEEEECRWKKEKDIQKWKRISREQKQCSESDHNTKCRRRVGQCKRKIEESGIWETEKDDDDDHPWKKSRNSYKVKENNSHSSLKIISESAQSTREDGYNHSGTADNKNTEWQKKEFAEFVAPKLSPSPAGSTDEACSSRMALVFPFSDDEEDEERGTEGGKHEIWPISDIVETEDEEGGQQETRGCCSIIFSGEDVSGGDNVGEDCSDSEEGVCGGSVGSEEDAGGGCGESEEYRYVGGGGGGDSDDEGGCDRDEDSGEGDGDEYEEENDGMGCGQSVGCKVTVKIRETARSSEPDQVNILITQEVVESGSVAGGDVVGGGGRGGDKGNDRGDSRTANAQDRTGNKHDQPDPLHSSLSGYADVPQEEDLRANDEGNTSPDEDNEGVDERRGDGEDSPRDSGVRATQRLRPRSYRQFLLTRERRSRVFLKARSYQLGRWFVTHFTHPYPSKDQKDQLANRTNMTRNQVCTGNNWPTVAY
ncbi:hypothetical protein Pcinc_009056 [Petrolisthes cinctipes]|uniref:KN homeodomain domain-containing protein n=1 Tax=Petrolisthes cinctipes TaxID=88211 RepID=A0AAE1G846_PETCI|nr:hypothetical protein Pcinc_009056 [Petrolisthes cinctipes]